MIVFILLAHDRNALPEIQFGSSIRSGTFESREVTMVLASR